MTEEQGTTAEMLSMVAANNRKAGAEKVAQAIIKRAADVAESGRTHAKFLNEQWLEDDAFRGAVVEELQSLGFQAYVRNESEKGIGFIPTWHTVLHVSWNVTKPEEPSP